MKKILLSIGLFIGLAFSSNAQWAYWTTNIVDQTNVVCIGGASNVVVSEISVMAGSGGATAINFYDNATATSQLTNNWYNSVVSYTTNLVSTEIMSSGVTNYVTNTGITFLTVSNAAGMLTLNPVVSFAVPAGSAKTISGVNATITRGLVATGVITNTTVIVRYRPWK